MIKKWQGVLIVLVFTLLLNTSFIAAQEKVTLRFSAMPDVFGNIAKMIELYENRYPNIDVVFVDQPAGVSASHDKYVIMFVAKDSTIDVMATPMTWPAEFIPAGWLMPLEDYFPPEEQKKYASSVIQAQTVNEHIYGVPYLLDLGIFYHRKDILKKAGMEVPGTWMDLVNICQKLQNPPELFGFIPCFSKNEQLSVSFQEYLWSNNGEYFDKEKKEVLFNQKEGVEALQFMVDLIHKYKIVQTGVLSMMLDEGRTIFTEGHAIFHRNWGYAWSIAQREGSKVAGEVGIDLIPRFSQGKHVSRSGGWSHSVNNFSKHKDEAAKFAVFMSSWEVQKYRAINGSRVPTILKLLTDPEVVAVHPVYPRFMEISLDTRDVPQHPLYTQMSDILQIEVHQALLQSKTPKEALDAAAKEIEALLQ